MRGAPLADAVVMAHDLALRPVSTSLHRLALGLRGQLVVLVDESAEHAAVSDVGEGRRNGGVPRHRRFEAEAPMWSVLVVVPDVLGERLFQVTTPEDEDPVQALSPHGPNEALNISIGDLTGVLMTSIPSAANTASKLELNFASRSRMRKRNGRPSQQDRPPSSSPPG